MKKKIQQQLTKEKFIVYEVKNSGKPKKLDITLEELQNYLDPKRVLIIIRYDFDCIFFWIGSESPESREFRYLDPFTSHMQRNLRQGNLRMFHKRFGLTTINYKFKIFYIIQGVKDQQRFNDLRGVAARLTDEEIMLLNLESEEGIKIINQYHDETGNFAVRRGKATRYFIKWLKGVTRKQIITQNFRTILENIENFLKTNGDSEIALELLATLLLTNKQKYFDELNNFFAKLKNREDFDETKYPYSEITKLFSGDQEYRKEFLRKAREPKWEIVRAGDDDDDRYPYPYVFKPPSPPDDLALAGRAQLRHPPKKKESEEKVACQYCGMELTKEEHLTHSCKKKPKGS